MIAIFDNKIFIDGKLFCTVELDNIDDPELVLDWMMSLIQVWFENQDKVLPHSA